MIYENILVTGGAGFIGSHVAEHYCRKGCRVVVYDNFSRAKLLRRGNRGLRHNWDFLKGKYGKAVSLIEADIRDSKSMGKAVSKADVVFHCAAQTAVTTSVVDPATDFSVNAAGTFQVLESIRKHGKGPVVCFCSTNKVYGENVNGIPVVKEGNHYRFKGSYMKGIGEGFPIDNCEHSPYGCSKLTGDLYMQDYARLYGLRIGIFRMSCIYGTRQFGMEDQGWVAHFVISTLAGKPISIYGDGKQVRDILWVGDLVEAYDSFIRSGKSHGVYNTGGGPGNVISLLELIEKIYKATGRKSHLSFKNWRPCDQKVFVSDISRIKKELDWQPTTTIDRGLGEMIQWTQDNMVLK
jgi:CDP-paratose 2-epimerase